ncbi:MAG TPA: hypothetical protein DCL54_04615 [Alphaproteobacteria bacterium]|nr:hypothetical protein [Alphaproteobacteria bacterium]HAJ45847.1 hypothetical protein [Alphaproteobacteria bacterium]
MELIQQYLDQLWALIQSGFYQVNDVRGIVIGAVGAYVMANYRRVLFVALGCTIAHVIVEVIGPVVVNRAQFKLPPLVEPEYWMRLVAITLGYVVIVSAFYLVKMLFNRLTGGGGGHGH